MSRSIAVAFIFTILYALSYANSYNGSKLYELYPSTQGQLKVLHKLSEKSDVYDFLVLSKIVEEPTEVIVSLKDDRQFRRFLLEHKIAYKIVEKNVGPLIEKDFQKQVQLRTSKPYISGRLSTERYYSHAEINSYLDDLAKRFPTRVYVKRVGISYEGRIMKTITITNGDKRTNKKVIFVDGGFHAREWISPATAIYVIEQLVENFAENSDLLVDYDWIVLPVVNADGYEFTQTSSSARLWRKTRQPHTTFLGNSECMGADPNRNFDFHWGEGGASPFTCVGIYAGPHAFSEPEAVVVRDIMHSLKGRGSMYLTLHSYGNYFLYPWGWTSDLPATVADLDDVAHTGRLAIFEATGTNYTVGSSTNVMYIAAGASDDYAFSVGFPISITMELTRGGVSGFDPPPEKIDPFVKEAWIGIRAMGLRVLQKYPLK